MTIRVTFDDDMNMPRFIIRADDVVELHLAVKCVTDSNLARLEPRDDGRLGYVFFPLSEVPK